MPNATPLETLRESAKTFFDVLEKKRLKEVVVDAFADPEKPEFRSTLEALNNLAIRNAASNMYIPANLDDKAALARQTAKALIEAINNWKASLEPAEDSEAVVRP